MPIKFNFFLKIIIYFKNFIKSLILFIQNINLMLKEFISFAIILAFAIALIGLQTKYDNSI